MGTRLRRRTAAALAAGSVLVLAPSAMAATGVALGEAAALEANGAAVIVPVEVGCDPGSPSVAANVQVTQRVGNRIAQGYGYSESLVCDSTTHTVELAVAAAERPFRRGTAFAQVVVMTCDEMTCRQATDAGPIEIVGR